MLDEGVQAFKRAIVNIFDKQCHSGLYTLKFPFLDHNAEHLRRFELLSVPDSSPYDHSNLQINYY